MSIRLIEISIPESHLASVVALAEDENVFLFDKDSSSPGRYLVKLVLPAKSTEQVMERLSKEFSAVSGFRAVILPVDATLPMIEEKKNGVQEKRKGVGSPFPKELGTLFSTISFS